MGKIRIQKLEIRNIMGIEHAEMECGKVNVITGDNGAGKTSRLRAIEWLLGGGSTVNLLRDGQEKGMVAALLEDGSQIVRKLLPSGPSLQILDASGKPVKKGASHLDNLVSAVALRPAAFLTAKDDERIKMLAQSFSSAVDEEKLDELCGPEWRDHIGNATLPIEIYKKLEDHAFKVRTTVNGQVKQCEATISQLSEALPDSPTADVDTKLAECDAKLAAMREAERSFTERSIQDETLELRAVESRFDDQIRELEEKLTKLRQERSEARNHVSRQAETQRHEYTKQMSAERATVEAERAALLEQRRQADKAKNTEAIIEQQQQALAENRERAEWLASVVESLRGLRAQAVAEVPVSGLEVRDGAVYLDGLPFDAVNEGRRIQAALQIARKAAGELPVICMDGVESLSPSTFASFLEAVENWDAQLFVVHVTDGPLSVITEKEFQLAAQ